MRITNDQKFAKTYSQLVPMLILASNSEARQSMLRNAGVKFDALPARVDEDMIKAAFLSEGSTPRDIADGLAEAKARKISGKHSEALILGSDQVLEFEGQIMSKPKSAQELTDNLLTLRGKKHKLFSAAVMARGGVPIWRHIGEAQIVMRSFSEDFLQYYVSENFERVRHCAGGYEIEGAGAQLIEDYRGDYFSILGLPLFAVLSYLREQGELIQ